MILWIQRWHNIRKNMPHFLNTTNYYNLVHKAHSFLHLQRDILYLSLYSSSWGNYTLQIRHGKHDCNALQYYFCVIFNHNFQIPMNIPQFLQNQNVSFPNAYSWKRSMYLSLYSGYTQREINVKAKSCMHFE